MITEPSRPRVLVLLASRNGAAFIARQIRSVAAQEGVHVWIEVRDDGSTDATREIVRELAASGLPVSLRIDHDAKGSAAANFFALMRGADIAAVDYVAFCDQDDEWLPQKLLRATFKLRTSGALGYSAATRAQWPDGRSKVLVQSAEIRPADYLFEGAGQGCTFVLAKALFADLQRDLERASGMLSALRYHDWAAYALTRSTGASWAFDAEPAMVYHQHDRNDTGARSSGAGVMRRLRLVRNGWYSAQVRAVVRLVQFIHPEDASAAEWARLDAPARRTTLGARLARLRFVARNGRRRASDRCLLIAAVALGHL